MFGYQDKINQILRGAETIKNMNDDIDLELSVSVLTKTLKDVQLERDALWVKTQEDERIINDLRDVNNELRQWKEEALKVMNQWNEVSDYINLNAEVEDIGRFVPQICLKYLKERDEMKKVEEQRDEAIRLATLFQALYLRYGKAEDESFNTIIVKQAAKSLANLKGLNYFGDEELEGIPNILKPMISKKFPDIVQSEITPVKKEK